MKLHNLSIKDKDLLERFLKLKPHHLSTYSFVNIYIWRGLFDIRWALIEDSLCLFFKDKMGCFLYLAPLSRNKNPDVIKKAFGIMDGFNKNKEISRIENIEVGDLSFYRGLDYNCQNKSPDYLCLRSDLVNLTGNSFKSKRANFNYFTKHHTFDYLDFSLRHKDGCLGLYDAWMKERKKRNKDPLYRGMLLDSRNSLKITLDNYADLNLRGRIIKINKKIKAFTFGFALNRNTFCVLYEIADLSIKGLSQFIFRRFCQELEGYKYINIMDDSGLENLRQVKLSYRPARLIPAYIIKRRDGSQVKREPSLK